MLANLTDHAEKRIQQRGINIGALDVIMQYGDPISAPGGALAISLTKKDASKLISSLKRQIKKIEKAQNVIVIEKNGAILTSYHKNSYR